MNEQPVSPADRNNEGGSQEPQRYEAWAYGYVLPVASGHSGPSASAWEVRPHGSKEVLERDSKTSITSNRNQWVGAIMAVVGVLECVPEGAIVSLRLRDEELGEAIGSKFRKTSGKPMRGEEFWRRLLDLLDRKRVLLEVYTVKKGDVDDVMDALIAEAANVAFLRLGELGAEKALANASPPKQRARNKGRTKISFTKVPGGYEEGTEPIRRKRPPRSALKKAEAWPLEEEDAEMLRRRAMDKDVDP